MDNDVWVGLAWALYGWDTAFASERMGILRVWLRSLDDGKIADSCSDPNQGNGELQSAERGMIEGLIAGK
jgi:hypothetical protein